MLFGTAADYRDPLSDGADRKENGCDALAADPLLLQHAVSNPPSPFPSKPTWMLTRAGLRMGRRTQSFAKCDTLECNWLGTDDSGRDVVARLIYGFRISVLFGLIAHHHLLGHRRRGRRRAGLFRRLDRPSVPTLHRDLDLDPLALSAADHLLGAGARASSCCSGSCCCSPGCRWSAWCAPNSCAGAISNTSRRRARSASRTRTIMFRHLLPNAMVATHDVPAVHPVGVGDDADRARFPRLRPAARLALARRTARRRARPTCRRRGSA